MYNDRLIIQALGHGSWKLENILIGWHLIHLLDCAAMESVSRYTCLTIRRQIHCVADACFLAGSGKSVLMWVTTRLL